MSRGRIWGYGINPGVSYSPFELADPAQRMSRLGVARPDELLALAPLVQKGPWSISTAKMATSTILPVTSTFIAARYGALLSGPRLASASGEGCSLRREGSGEFAGILRQFAKRFSLQIYLEPGESEVTRSTELVTTVTDIVHNEADIAIVNASIEAHMPDLLARSLALSRVVPGTGCARRCSPLQANDHRHRVGDLAAVPHDGHFHGHLFATCQIAERRRGALRADGSCGIAALDLFLPSVDRRIQQSDQQFRAHRQGLLSALDHSHGNHRRLVRRPHDKFRDHGCGDGLVSVSTELAHLRPTDLRPAGVSCLARPESLGHGAERQIPRFPLCHALYYAVWPLRLSGGLQFQHGAGEMAPTLFAQSNRRHHRWVSLERFGWKKRDLLARHGAQFGSYRLFFVAGCATIPENGKNLCGFDLRL